MRVHASRTDAYIGKVSREQEPAQYEVGQMTDVVAPMSHNTI